MWSVYNVFLVDGGERGIGQGEDSQDMGKENFVAISLTIFYLFPYLRCHLTLPVSSTYIFNHDLDLIVFSGLRNLSESRQTP